MDDLAGLTLRELLTLARERLGAAASGLKTREELVSALASVLPERSRGAQVPPVLDSARGDRPEVVTRDFFVLRKL